MTKGNNGRSIQEGGGCGVWVSIWPCEWLRESLFSIHLHLLFHFNLPIGQVNFIWTLYKRSLLTWKIWDVPLLYDYVPQRTLTSNFMQWLEIPGGNTFGKIVDEIYSPVTSLWDWGLGLITKVCALKRTEAKEKIIQVGLHRLCGGQGLQLLYVYLRHPLEFENDSSFPLLKAHLWIRKFPLFLHHMPLLFSIIVLEHFGETYPSLTMSKDHLWPCSSMSRWFFFFFF